MNCAALHSIGGIHFVSFISFHSTKRIAFIPLRHCWASAGHINFIHEQTSYSFITLIVFREANLLNWNWEWCLLPFAFPCGALRRAAATNPQIKQATTTLFIQLNLPPPLFIHFIQTKLKFYSHFVSFSIWRGQQAINSSFLSINFPILKEKVEERKRAEWAGGWRQSAVFVHSFKNASFHFI